uniref:Putative lipocalin-5 1 n=1 Tax=Amblyomma triste TaxID=251400 RepID=A0A023G928_AMBTT
MTWIAFLTLFGAFSLQSFCGIEAKSEETVDAFQAAESLPEVVLLAATAEIPCLECVTADLTALDPSQKSVTYTWHMRGPNGQAQMDFPLKFNISKESPDMGVAYINSRNSDTRYQVRGQALYTDYESCLIGKLFFGPLELCIQWVTPEVVSSVPEECATAMEEECGEGVLLYKEDACK